MALHEMYTLKNLGAGEVGMKLTTYGVTLFCCVDDCIISYTLEKNETVEYGLQQLIEGLEVINANQI